MDLQQSSYNDYKSNFAVGLFLFYRTNRCRIAEKHIDINLNSRIIFSQIAEKYHSILPNMELINYLCSSKCFNLWMVIDIE